MLDFDDFKKIDLRVGRIIEIKNHPNADKLYVLTVDLGDEKRTIVAGLKQYYKPKDLLNKLVVLVANLEPKKLRGVESQGMILAAEKDGKVSLITVDREIEPGARIF